MSCELRVSFLSLGIPIQDVQSLFLNHQSHDLHSEFYKPSATDGPLVYLNGNPDVQNIVDKIEAAGGKILVPKTLISEEYGYMAVFLDTEGNRIGLHSVPQ